MAEAKRIEGAKVRYAVVGVGWISQAAFMPGVAQTGNSVMTALVTGDPEKGRVLGERYGIRHVFGYHEYEAMLASGEVDAVYLALPNEQHHAFAVATLNAGLHLLLEKPMAVSVAECEAINAAAAASGAKLMVAYRLHHEPATLEAIRLVREGVIGDPRVFTSTFSQHVSPHNHRVQQGYWAGPVADMGAYPINAVRNLFGAEPIEVSAVASRNEALGFPEGLDDTVAVTLRFPEERIANFVVSYGAASTDVYRVVGSKGDLELSPAFQFTRALRHKLTVDGGTTEREFPPTDQFGGQLQYFSRCVVEGRKPEADGEDGMFDVRVIAAVEEALRTKAPVTLAPAQRRQRPEPAQGVELPPVAPPPLVNAATPGEG